MFKDVCLTLIFKDCIWNNKIPLSYTSCLKTFQAFINYKLLCTLVKFGFILPGPEKLHEKIKAQSHGTGNRTPLFSVTYTPASLLTLLAPCFPKHPPASFWSPVSVFSHSFITPMSPQHSSFLCFPPLISLWHSCFLTFPSHPITWSLVWEVLRYLNTRPPSCLSHQFTRV